MNDWRWSISRVLILVRRYSFQGHSSLLFRRLPIKRNYAGQLTLKLPSIYLYGHKRVFVWVYSVIHRLQYNINVTKITENTGICNGYMVIEMQHFYTSVNCHYNRRH